MTIIASLLSSAATYGLVQWGEHKKSGPPDTPPVGESAPGEADGGILWTRKTTDIVAETRKALEGQASFLAAKATRDYTQAETIRVSVLGVPSTATVILEYQIEYSFGYDLRPGHFTVTVNPDRSMTLHLDRPHLVATPAVRMLGHRVVDSGVLVDEKEAIIAIQGRLPELAQAQAFRMQRDEATIALSEKSLSNFLRDFLGKQAGTQEARVIKFDYGAPTKEAMQQ